MLPPGRTAVEEREEREADPADGEVDRDDDWSFRYDSAGCMLSACQAGSCTGSSFNRVDATCDGARSQQPIRRQLLSEMTTRSTHAEGVGLVARR